MVHSMNQINKHVSTFTFVSTDPQKSIYNELNDVQLFGKYYRIKSLSKIHSSIVRYYSIFNCLESEQFKEYLRLLDLAIRKKDTSDFINYLRSTQDTNRTHLTLKNDGIPSGLSHKIFSSEDNDTYEMYGPLGQGLLVQH